MNSSRPITISFWYNVRHNKENLIRMYSISDRFYQGRVSYLSNCVWMVYYLFNVYILISTVLYIHIFIIYFVAYKMKTSILHIPYIIIYSLVLWRKPPFPTRLHCIYKVSQGLCDMLVLFIFNDFRWNGKPIWGSFRID